MNIAEPEVAAATLQNDPFSVLPDDTPAVVQERAIRRMRWADFVARTFKNKTTWADLRDSYIFRPQGQGIWLDVERTRKAGIPFEIAHSVIFSDGYDEEEPDGERFSYAYPRPSIRSESEIEGMKAAHRLLMPIFFVDGSSRTYTARVAWVVDFNDETSLFLLGVSPPSASEIRDDDLDETPFPTSSEVLKKGTYSKTLRPGQRNFRYDVLERYGAVCMMCTVDVGSVLDAAHIIPHAFRGPRDARNGLVLCTLHHSAFDSGLVRIHPKTLKFEIADDIAPARLAITREGLEYLERRPAIEALDWRYITYPAYNNRTFKSA